VLLAIGFVFLPASTLPEKAYVLFACLALSVAVVTGIGAWRSARRFGVTATSMCVAVLCLAALSMTAQRNHPAIAAAGSHTSAAKGSTQPKDTTPTKQPSPPASPGQSHAAASTTPASDSPSPGASVIITGCGLNPGGTAYAKLSITNHTSSNSTFYVDVGFYQDGNEFTDYNSEPTIGAGSTYEDTVNSDPLYPAPGRGTVSCKVLQLNDEG
jgi:hypothetical protein